MRVMNLWFGFNIFDAHAWSGAANGRPPVNGAINICPPLTSIGNVCFAGSLVDELAGLCHTYLNLFLKGSHFLDQWSNCVDVGRGNDLLAALAWPTFLIANSASQNQWKRL